MCCGEKTLFFTETFSIKFTKKHKYELSVTRTGSSTHRMSVLEWQIISTHFNVCFLKT